jgi:hypothetical protein
MSRWQFEFQILRVKAAHRRGPKQQRKAPGEKRKSAVASASDAAEVRRVVLTTSKAITG